MGNSDHRWGASTRGGRALAAAIGAFLLFAAIGACTGQEAPRFAAAQEVGMKTVILPIEGMSCVACAARIKKTLTSIDGVSAVEVNLAERNARVRFAPSKLSPSRLVAAVNGLGYQASTPAEAK
jgi:copper chaperone CopZ